jgi:hypothetical protein
VAEQEIKWKDRYQCFEQLKQFVTVRTNQAEHRFGITTIIITSCMQQFGRLATLTALCSVEYGLASFRQCCSSTIENHPESRGLVTRIPENQEKL